MLSDVWAWPKAPRPDPDLETCSHRHDILAVGVEADADFPVPMTLYRWCPPAVRTITRVVLSPRLLSMVGGFTPLGGGNPEPTPQIVADLMAEMVEPKQGAFMRFFSFPVLSNEPSRILADGFFPVWKWVKPESIYRRGGLWEPDLSSVLGHGEWDAGKGLVILAVGVKEEAWQFIVAGDRKFPTLGGLLTKYL
ncbi:uncharacterized protein B0H64DRAFT_419530 [Chaetomium fimeti]|uniref:Uncharacterized protein n=1 Tax=Chaetomium fimeti TaxID=1854472 RepID=A0AAE0H8Z3_9PEZI|nr:hypothetical protein B0H64DRAFT_419530 [Chaetomium fimeti]